MTNSTQALRHWKEEKLRRLHLKATTERYRRYQTDPVGYARDVLGVVLTSMQERMLLSLVLNRRTAVKASHAVGKTFLAAIAACWWYDCWEEHIVYISAPTWGQALGLTFKTITRLRRKCKLSGRILETGLLRDEDPYRAGAHYIKALNAQTGEGFQGEHTSEMLIILEEAVGVPPYIWEATNGLMTSSACRMLAIANPTDESGDFGQACASGVYEVITINGLEHPNVLAGLAARRAGRELETKKLPFPGAVELSFVEEMIASECEPADGPGESNFEFPPHSGLWYTPNALFMGRVQGEFPTQADEQVIPRGWLTNLPRLPVERENGVEIGVDVARYGSDRTCIAARSGPNLLALKELRQMDTMRVTGVIIQVATEAAARFGLDAKRLPIRIDVTGGLGAGPHDRLLEEGFVYVSGVNSSEKARQEEKFPNVRSELWWSLRERAKEKRLDMSGLPDYLREKLIRELAAPTYRHDSRGRIVVEPKADTKKRINGESPDLADAVNLAFYGESVVDWGATVVVSREEALRPAERGEEVSEALGVVW